MTATKNIELTFMNRPVVDLDALKSIVTTDVVDGVIVSVGSLGLWQFNKLSEVVGDNSTSASPTEGGGCWFLIGFINTDGKVTAPLAYLSNLTHSTVLSCDANKKVQSLAVGTSLTLAANSLNTVQDIRTTATPEHASSKLSALTASTIVSCTAEKVLQSLTLGDSLDLTTNELDTAQDIRDTATPEWVSVTLSALTVDSLVASDDASKLVSVTLGDSITLTAEELNTVQEITEISDVEFGSVTADIITDSLTEATLGAGVTIPTGIFMQYETDPVFTPDSTQIATVKFVEDSVSAENLFDRDEIGETDVFKIYPHTAGDVLEIGKIYEDDISTIELSGGYLRYPNTTLLGYSKDVATADATGDGTAHKILYDTEVIDMKSNFAVLGSTVTTTIAGYYHGGGVLALDDMGGTYTTLSLDLITTDFTLNLLKVNAAELITSEEIVLPFEIPLTLIGTGKEAYLQVTISGNATADVTIASTHKNRFWLQLASYYVAP